MPDANDPRSRGPAGWGDAFAALPQETPPADAWSRVAARLDARATAAAAQPTTPSGGSGIHRPHGRRRPARAAGWLGAAAAAALALVVAWPKHEPAPGIGHPVDASNAAASSNGASVPQQASAAPTPSTAPAATAIALPKAVEASRKPRYAARQAPAPTGAAQAATTGGAAPGAQPLDALYVESARLETLLALARDERVATASAALLSAELDAQVAAIDVRLAQPGLDDAQRTALWQARVDALRQAAGFESTQRVLASQGDGGALLVSVD